MPHDFRHRQILCATYFKHIGIARTCLGEAFVFVMTMRRIGGDIVVCGRRNLVLGTVWARCLHFTTPLAMLPLSPNQTTQLRYGFIQQSPWKPQTAMILLLRN